MVRLITQWLGVRGVVLFLFGAPWIMYGISVISLPTEKFSKPGPGGALEFLDHPGWGYFWIAAGVFAISATLLRKRSAKHDELAYGFLAAPAALWTFGYLTSAILYVTTNGEWGAQRAYIGCIIFGNFLILILFLSRNLHDVEVKDR